MATRRNRDTGHHRYNVAGLPVIIASVVCLRNEFMLTRLYLYSVEREDLLGVFQGDGQYGDERSRGSKKVVGSQMASIQASG